MIYLVNLNQEQFIKKRSKWLPKIQVGVLFFGLLVCLSFFFFAVVLVVVALWSLSGHLDGRMDGWMDGWPPLMGFT
jgi:hypothetical protein